MNYRTPTQTETSGSGLFSKLLDETISSLHRRTGPEALALGKPSEYTVDDKIGGTHTRTVHDPVVHETVLQHAHHEVTPIVNRVREETEIHQSKCSSCHVRWSEARDSAWTFSEGHKTHSDFPN